MIATMPPTANPAPTTRELEVLEAAVRLGYQGAADELDLAIGTIRTTLQRLYRKLDVETQAQALRELARRGVKVPRRA